ncbi:MAG: DUF2244 domain-containing protein [SAR86 cluster bacterium]|uniref:DUF2244 domain-containing protein n=1 Tax=SAR86 cluster bacterium TaxID=2030880 RepID=A0A520MVU0_9GAMM|nr:MAG: DUF2244 domain-containing protein [SAR86 cluster bacterium]
MISLSPNSSLVGVYRIIFLSSITFVCGGIAITFYFVGASLILPFAGIELTVLFIAFYLSFKWSSKKEKIYISQETVKIEKGTNKAEYLWEEFRTFTSFQIKKEKDKTLRLSFKSKGQDVYFGDFLNEDDKNLLKDSIKDIIEELNAQIN